MTDFSNIIKEKWEKILVWMNSVAHKIGGWAKEYRMAAVPVGLVIFMAFLNLGLLAYLEKPWGIFSSSDLALADSSNSYFSGGFSGANENVETSNFSEGAVANQSPIDSFSSSDSGEQINFILIDGAYLLNKSNPLSDSLPNRDGLLAYKVQKGDNLAKIAANFGISLNTILWANTKINANSLKIGQEIVILPVSGVIYDVRPGDTLNSIAEKYSADVNKIISYNVGLSPSKLESRDTIIIPYAKPLKTTYYTGSVLPEYPGYFAVPTTGWNWGKLHNYNAVDIANACGTAVYASAEGLVSEVYSSGWNNGYGIYVVIEHPNNTKTLYSHMQKAIVSVGDYVSQGDTIGYIGNTGKTDGVTGCHLHLEVIGAKNPFAK